MNNTAQAERRKRTRELAVHLPAQDTVSLAERVRELTCRFRRFDLRALPRPHNHPADRLACLALARATAAQMAGDSYTEQ